MKRKILILVVGVSLALATVGCSSHHASAPPPTTAPAPSTASPATTAAPPNPDVIPSVITPAYVDAVFAILNHVYGDATRSLASAHAVTPEVRADLRAIFANSLYLEQLSQAHVSLEGAISNVRPNPGDGVTVVTRLISASQTCVFVETRTDLSSVLIHPTPPAASEYYELSEKPAEDDPLKLNPTPWEMSFNVDYLTPTTIANQCASS